MADFKSEMEKLQEEIAQYQEKQAGTVDKKLLALD